MAGVELIFCSKNTKTQKYIAMCKDTALISEDAKYSKENDGSLQKNTAELITTECTKGMFLDFIFYTAESYEIEKQETGATYLWQR